MKLLKSTAFACLAGLCLVGSAEAMPVAPQTVAVTAAAPVVKTAVVLVRRRPVVRLVRRRPVAVIRKVIR